jgi:LmbE family N-acetylglucosaminyl deacetylase
MRPVLATHHFSSLGGSQTYLLTVAQQLLRLGHDPTIFSLELGDMSALAQERGIPVTDDENELPDDCDALLVQDGVVALLLAERYPRLPQLFVAHSADLDLSFPPRLGDLTHAVVVLNDRVGRTVKSLAGEHQLVRLRQPIDLDRFMPTGLHSERPRRALIHSSYLHSSRRELVVDVLAQCGIEYLQVGAHGIAMDEPRAAIADADIVFGYGRSILEAMACGRAAYVLDQLGGDGWVTRESYAELEADGFYGSATEDVVDLERLRRDLAGYRREMGVVNADLARLHHNARAHTVTLVELLRRVRPGAESAPGRLRELARLRRMSWEAESRAAALALESRAARDDAERLRDIERTACQAVAANDALKRTRRYRLASALARPIDLLRSLRPQRNGPDPAPARAQAPGGAVRREPGNVVLSPHPDDAVLSCWSVLERGGQVSVVTVFSGLPDEEAPSSAGDRLAGVVHARAAMTARIEEDREALAAVVRTLVQMPFVDAAYRVGELRQVDLVWAIGSALVPGDRIFAPAGLGGHPDHLALRRAALELRDQGFPATLYADFPYAAAFGWPGWVTDESPQPELHVDHWWESQGAEAGVSFDAPGARVVRLGPAAHAAKVEALRTYRTQFPLLEGGPQRRLTNPSLSGFEVFWRLDSREPQANWLSTAEEDSRRPTARATGSRD